MSGYTDLFGNHCEWTPAPKKKKSHDANGYPAPPGSGPSGETCKTCEFKYKKGDYWKCLKFVSPSCVGKSYQWSSCASSDIRLKSPACRFWEKALSAVQQQLQTSLRRRGPFQIKELR